MSVHEMKVTGNGSKTEDSTTEHINGYFRCLIGLGAGQLFCGVAALALGIANAIVCGKFGSIGYGIWGSLIVSGPKPICIKLLFSIAGSIHFSE